MPPTVRVSKPRGFAGLVCPGGFSTVAGMQIRTATLADAEHLTELWEAAGLKFGAADVPAELSAVLARDPGLVVVAEDADGLAAAVLGTFDGRRGWVSRLATRPGRRGHGYASAVLAELERRLAARGCRKVNLLIEQDNKKVTSFYSQHGYTEDQLIFMEKWLTPGTSAHQPPQPHAGAS